MGLHLLCPTQIEGMSTSNKCRPGRLSPASAARPFLQMEGIDPACADRRVLLIGATNRPEELDEAARRRMPKQLYIPLPDAGECCCLFRGGDDRLRAAHAQAPLHPSARCGWVGAVCGWRAEGLAVLADSSHCYPHCWEGCLDRGRRRCLARCPPRSPHRYTHSLFPIMLADARLDLILRQLGPGGPIKAQLGEADLKKVVARTEGYSG